MVTLLRTGHFSRRHSEAGMPCPDMNCAARSAFLEERGQQALYQADPRCTALTLPTSSGPPAGSVYVSCHPRPSFALLDPPPRGAPVPSHSLLLFGGNPPRYVFGPFG